MERILWQVFTLVSPGLINQREKTGGAVCLNPGGHDKRREWRGSEREEPVFLSTRVKLASNISTQIQTHTLTHALPPIVLELSKSKLVLSFSSPVFHPSDVAFK